MIALFGSIPKIASLSSVSATFMPGQYGNVKVTVQNLEIVKVDAENNLIAIKGAIPGPKNGTVTICDCVKKA